MCSWLGRLHESCVLLPLQQPKDLQIQLSFTLSYFGSYQLAWTSSKNEYICAKRSPIKWKTMHKYLSQYSLRIKIKMYTHGRRCKLGKWLFLSSITYSRILQILQLSENMSLEKSLLQLTLSTANLYMSLWNVQRKNAIITGWLVLWSMMCHHGSFVVFINWWWLKKNKKNIRFFFLSRK